METAITLHFGRLPADLRAQYHTARRKLSNLLRGNPNFCCLRKHVDSALGIPQLLTIRRTTRRTNQAVRDQRWLAKHKPVHCESVVLEDRCVLLEENLVESTKREIIRFLKSPDLSTKLDRIRLKTIDWLQSANPMVFQ